MLPPVIFICMRAMQDVVGGLGAAVIGVIQSSSLLLLPTPHIEE